MTYCDIKITGDALELDGGEPVMIFDRDVIVQDLIHMIRESGLPELLVAEKDPDLIKLILNRIVLLCEEDDRVVPGSIRFDTAPERYLLSGESYEFGTFNAGVKR